MKPLLSFSPIVPSLTLSLLLLSAPQGLAAGDDKTPGWPGFRGDGRSASDLADLPLKWSDTEGIAWRAALAGFGQSSPVIWGDQVYLTSTGGDHKEQLFVQAFDLKSGAEKWKKTFAATQKAAEVSDMISRGAPTPVADVAGVYAFFESGDLVALDSRGELRWERRFTTEFGEFKGGHGIGSSPVAAGAGRLVLLIDHDGPSYLLCVDTATGKTLWKTDREPRVSWTSPLYVEHDGVPQILISSNGVAESYAAADGALLWRFDGLRGNTVASPTQQGSIVIVGSSEPGGSLAIRLGGKGDVTETHLAWKAQGATVSFGSPLIRGEQAYFVNRAGAVQANRLSDGTRVWEQRLPDSCWATPLAAGNRLYFFCKNGRTAVLEPQADGSVKELAENAITVPDGDRVYGFAVAPKRIVVRLATEIATIGEK